jgi:hypothetical protein
MLQRPRVPPRFGEEDVSPVKRDNSKLIFKALFVSLVPYWLSRKESIA